MARYSKEDALKELKELESIVMFRAENLLKSKNPSCWTPLIHR